MKILLFVFILVNLVPAASDTSLPSIAVLDLEPKGISADEASLLSEKLRGELVNRGSFSVVERGVMTQILKEQGFQQTGCTSTDCAVQMGQLIGVKFMVAGTIGKIEDTYLLSARLISVASGKIEKSVQLESERNLTNVLTDDIPECAKQLSERPEPVESRKKPEPEPPRQETEPAPQPEKAAAPAAIPEPLSTQKPVAFKIGLGYAGTWGIATLDLPDTIVSGTPPDTTFDSTTKRGVITGGVSIEAGLRLKNHHIGLQGMATSSSDVAFGTGKRVMTRKTSGGGLVYDFEGWTIKRWVLVAPGLAVGVWRTEETFTRPDTLGNLTAKVTYSNYVAPRLSIEVGPKHFKGLLRYSLLLGGQSDRDHLEWTGLGSVFASERQAKYHASPISVLTIGATYTF